MLGRFFRSRGIRTQAFQGLWVVLVTLVFLVPGECQVPAQVPSAPASPPVQGVKNPAPGPHQPMMSPDYVVAPQDLLEVDFFDVPEISRPYRVSSNGFLNLPLLTQPLAAAGLTLPALEKVIASRYRQAGMLTNAQVTVSVRETRFHSVVITGAVRSPQVYPIYGPTRLLDVIAAAGGLTEAAGNTATVVRGAAGLKAEAEENAQGGAGGQKLDRTTAVDVWKLMQTGEEKYDVLLYPGDRVSVLPAALVYVLGAVMRPGGYTLKDPQENMTALKALAMAGGLGDVAKKDQVKLFRMDPTAPSGRKEIALNLDDIIKGKARDAALQSDDILFVPESGALKAFRKAMGTGLSVGTALTTGLIIYHR